ncbi:DUF554 family protein [Paenibacillus illinoisensis]|uniref:DUF554 family protein n=1 Tax=Paenibacillus illinoisensis TaxID=59845 RepID=UPI003CE6F6F0
MLGILVNCFSIVFGSTLGAITKKFVNDGYKAILYQVIGISAIIIGISTTINSISTSQYQVMFVIFLTVGGIIGQFESAAGLVYSDIGVIDWYVLFGRQQNLRGLSCWVSL